MKCIQVSGAGEIRPAGVPITFDRMGRPGLLLLGLACSETATTRRANLDENLSLWFSSFSFPASEAPRLLRCDVCAETLSLKPETADTVNDVLLLFPDQARGQKIEFAVEGFGGGQLYADCDFRWDNTTGYCALARLTPGSSLIARAPLPIHGVRYRRCWSLEKNGSLKFDAQSSSLRNS
jgi:hypothetical protein